MEAASRFGDVKNESGKYLVVFDLINSEKYWSFSLFIVLGEPLKDSWDSFFVCVYYKF